MDMPKIAQASRAVIVAALVLALRTCGHENLLDCATDSPVPAQCSTWGLNGPTAWLWLLAAAALLAAWIAAGRIVKAGKKS